MANASIDSKQVRNNFQKLLMGAVRSKKQSEYAVAGEILRLASFEVPLDKGLLQNSGSIQQESRGTIVGFNKVYAARLHEHPEYKFKNGRKGKYLEDPIKNNLHVFTPIVGKIAVGNMKV